MATMGERERCNGRQVHTGIAGPLRQQVVAPKSPSKVVHTANHVEPRGLGESAHIHVQLQVAGFGGADMHLVL
jgi:hypothetical protein